MRLGGLPGQDVQHATCGRQSVTRHRTARTHTSPPPSRPSDIQIDNNFISLRRRHLTSFFPFSISLSAVGENELIPCGFPHVRRRAIGNRSQSDEEKSTTNGAGIGSRYRQQLRPTGIYRYVQTTEYYYVDVLYVHKLCRLVQLSIVSMSCFIIVVKYAIPPRGIVRVLRSRVPSSIWKTLRKTIIYVVIHRAEPYRFPDRSLRPLHNIGSSGRSTATTTRSQCEAGRQRAGIGGAAVSIDTRGSIYKI